MKLAIVVDSSCGLTKKEAESRGWHFLPLYLDIDGKEYRDGIDITSDNFLDYYKPTSIGKTSCTPIGEALQLIEDLDPAYEGLVSFACGNSKRALPVFIKFIIHFNSI